MPAYLSEVTLTASTENFYWASRLIAALADPHFGACIQPVERYQDAVAVRGRQLVREYDAKMLESGDFSLCAEANEKLAAMAKEQTDDALGKLLQIVSEKMKNGYDRADN